MTKKTVSPDTFCPLLAIAHAMTGGPRSNLCSPNCAWYDAVKHGCGVASLADNVERIADALDAIEDRKGAQ